MNSNRKPIYFTALRAATVTLETVTQQHPTKTLAERRILARHYLTRMIQSGLFVITD